MDLQNSIKSITLYILKQLNQLKVLLLEKRNSRNGIGNGKSSSLKRIILNGVTCMQGCFKYWIPAKNMRE